MKKIISYSIWGSDPKYFKNIIPNIKLAKELYPGWICRFYYDNTVPSDIIQQIIQEGGEVSLQPKSDGFYGMFWRFYPMDDDSVERFIVRDADSLLSEREADAIKEWTESGLPFHTMRDNPMHNFWILGGMWGAVPVKLKINIKLEIDKWLKNNSSFVFKYIRGKYFNTDQLFLKDVIWPRIINKHMAHESIETDFAGIKKRFRVENKDGMFIGEPI